MNVKLISMNYENVCGYLCFCCADAVDCGVGDLTWMSMDRYGLGIGTMRCIVFTLTFDSSPIKGEGDMVGLGLLFAHRNHPLDYGPSPQ